MKIEFSMELFYKVGIGCFLIMGMGNIYSFLTNMYIIDWGARFARFGTIIFNFALVALFMWLLKGSKGAEELKNDEDILKALE